MAPVTVPYGRLRQQLTVRQVPGLHTVQTRTVRAVYGRIFTGNPLIIPLATSCLLTPLVLFISMPNPTQLQSFLDVKLGLPPLCTARILLGSVLRAARSTLPLRHLLIFKFSFYSTHCTDGITHFIGLFVCQCLGFDPLHKVPT
jgi:hypothetical protein